MWCIAAQVRKEIPSGVSDECSRVLSKTFSYGIIGSRNLPRIRFRGPSWKEGGGWDFKYVIKFDGSQSETCPNE